ncbi:MAG TPA: hypothetical protein VFT49_02795 [Candidatus Saccharimonadales bacterium]|nr:hypothetical protein [Candidatus Saccharimonadales bacterium]
MKTNEKDSLFVLAGVIAFFVGLVLAGMFVHGPKRGSITINSVPALPTSFPDVKNDSAYKNFLNSNALDPTQAIQLGNSNSSPFSSSQ